MAWFLMAAGAVLAAAMLWVARPSRRRPPLRPEREHDRPPAPDPDDPRAAAWAVLQRPVQTEPNPWEELATRPALRQFRLGAAFGLGVGLAVAGLLVAVVPGRPPGSAGNPPAGAPAAQGSAPPTPAAPAPAPAPGAGAPAAPAVPAPAPGGPAPGPAAGAPAAPATPAAPVVVVVEPGDLPAVVAGKLKAAGVIQDTGAFLDRLTARQADTRIMAGVFRIPAGADLDAVIDALIG